MTATEQRSGLRLPWSSDRHAAPANAPASASEPDPTVVDEPQVEAPPVGDGGADGSASSWVMNGWAGRAPGGGGTDGAGSSEMVAGSGDNAGQTQTDATVAEARPAWPAEDTARVSVAATAAATDGGPSIAPATDTAAATEAQLAALDPAETPEHLDAPEAGAMSPTITPAPATTGRTTGSAGVKPNRFMADLSRAMQAAAQASRDESLARLATEAKQRIEEIQQLGTTGSTELRRRADDDVAATREWAKAEIARIREETERLIAERKARLESDVERHAGMVRRRADQVREAVVKHETELAGFIDQLLAEEDPGRIATLAQHMPEPPMLDQVDLVESLAQLGDEAAPGGRDARAGTNFDTATADSQDTGAGMAHEAAGDDVPGAGATAWLSAESAAAAEAEALSGLDGGDGGGDAWFAGGADDARADTVEDGAGRTDLIVKGLASVAGIAGFKRELSRIEGVRAVGVSAGHGGEFVFAVTHAPDVDLAGLIASITAFDARVRDRTDGTLLVTTTEPVAAE